MKIIKAGFSLVELCVVIIIVGVLMAGAATMARQQQTIARETATKTNLANIRAGLIAYKERTGHYPCPASLTSAVGTAGFATSADCSIVTITPGTCSGGLCVQNGRLYDHDSNPGTADIPMRIRIGAVPARDLSLPFESMADGQKRLITYAVTERMATTEAEFGALDAGGIPIVDEGDISVLTPASTAEYILISHGPDGAGAYNYGPGTQYRTCSTGALDSKNCAFTTATAKFQTAGYAEAAGATHFDDRVLFNTSVIAAPTTPATASNADPIIVQSDKFLKYNITNPGSGNSGAITRRVAVGGSLYKIESDTCTGTLDQDQTCTIQVGFRSDSGGAPDQIGALFVSFENGGNATAQLTAICKASEGCIGITGAIHVSGGLFAARGIMASQWGGVNAKNYGGQQYCEDMTDHGYSDWRVPTMTELGMMYTNKNSAELATIPWTASGYQTFWSSGSASIKNLTSGSDSSESSIGTVYYNAGSPPEYPSYYYVNGGAVHAARCVRGKVYP